MRRRVRAMALLPVASVLHAQTVLHVDDDAAPGGDGSSWDVAFGTLAEALSRAEVLDDEMIEVRVAEGTYPAPVLGNRFGGDPDGTHSAVTLRILGGWSGVGDERDPSSFVSVVDGDLLGDDDGTFANRDDNAVRLFDLSGPRHDVEIEGFDLVGGGSSSTDAGGIVRASGLASLTLSEVHVSGGFAEEGAGLHVRGDLVVRGGSFHQNLAFKRAGAIFQVEGESDARIEGVVFESNDASTGASLVLRGEAGVENCVFRSHSSEAEVVATSGDGHMVRVVGCTFVGNVMEAPMIVFEGASEAFIANTILFANDSGCVLEARNDLVTIESSILEGGVSALCGPSTVVVGDGVQDVDPGLDGALVPTRLGAATDAGAASSATTTTDAAGLPRVVDGDEDGNAMVDLGAYEYQATCPADLTGDGVLEISDILAFLNLFDSGEADWDNDGVVGIFDIVGYLDVFDAGC